MAEYMKEFHSNSGIFVKGYLKVKLPFGKQIATNQIPPELTSLVLLSIIFLWEIR